jgi:hypothetical protein
MASSRRELLTGILALLAAPATLRAEDAHNLAAGPSCAVSARVRLPSGQWKRFSCSFPNGHPLDLDVALACVRDLNGVHASDVTDLTIT